jgi:hypothetical protein
MTSGNCSGSSRRSCGGTASLTATNSFPPSKRPWPPTSPDSQGNRNDTYTAISPEYRTETLRKLQKLIPTVQALVEETRDKELGEVLTAVAAKVTL